MDNSFISKVCLDKEHSKAFYRYVNKNKVDVLLNKYLIFEAMNSSNLEHVQRRIEFIRRIPRKRILARAPFIVYDLEILETYHSKSLPTQDKIQSHFTKVLNRENWKEKIRELEAEFAISKDQLTKHIHNWLFSKSLSISGDRSKKKFVKNFMNPKFANGRIADEYARKVSSNMLKQVKPGKFIEGLAEYGHGFLKKIGSMTIDQFQRKVHRNIILFSLNGQVVYDMEMGEYLEYDYYLSHLLGIVDKYFYGTERHRFLLEMAKYRIQSFPGAYLQWRTHTHILDGGDPAKHRDPMDLFYLFLAPYVDEFVADANMKENVRQVIRKEKIDIDFGKFLSVSEALEKYVA